MTRSSNRRVRRAAILVVVFAAGAGGIIWAWPGRAPDGLALGRDAYDHGDWSGADDHARAFLATRKDDRDALRLLARASARLGRDDMAKRLYQRLGADTMEPEDNLLIALTLVREGR